MANVGQNDMQIIPLGAGQEVGRSCCILKFMGKTIMLDCGVHPAYSGIASLPFFDEVDADEIDLVLITHYHLDHSAGLPYLMERTNFNPKASVIMTQPTRAIYKALLSDFVRVSKNAPGEESLYTEDDVNRTMARIQVVDYHAEVNVNGIKIRAFYAAHVLGGAMFMIEIAGIRVLYTGDYSREEDRHLKAAEIPPFRPDVLIIESTYGVQEHENRRFREKRFTDRIARTVRQGGRALLPVFALGRAQELLLILDEYWEENPDLQHIPIYYASAVAHRCMPVYQTYINMMNDNVRRRFEISNPFEFKHVRNIRNASHFEDDGPCVFMASPGMLQNGLSRELFERWCGNKANSIVISGYSVDGTLAKKLEHEPEVITRQDGRPTKVLCSIEHVTFSAHADFRDTRMFVEETRPTHCVLVHGEKNNMSRLRSALDSIHNKGSATSDKRHPLQLHSPQNCATVKLTFQNSKTVRAIDVVKPPTSIPAAAAKQQSDLTTPGPEQDGKLAPGTRVSGLLIQQDFAYTLVKPQSLPQYTQLKLSQIDQHQVMQLKKPFLTLATQLKTLFRNIHYDDDAKFIVLADGAVRIEVKADSSIRMSWASGYASDTLTEAIATVVMSDSPHALDQSVEDVLKVGRKLLAARFGCKIRWVKGSSNQARFVVELTKIALDMFTGEVTCTDNLIKERVRLAYRRIKAALFPIPDSFCKCCC